MILFLTLTALFLIVQCIVTEKVFKSTVQPADFSDENSPDHVVPTGSDIPPGV